MANGSQNVIETILRSVDEMSKDLTLVTQRMREMQGQAQGTGGGFEKMTQRSVNLQRQLLPLRSAVAQVTTAVATMNPEFSVAIGTVDNLAFAFIRAGQGAATAGAAIKAGLLAILSPLNIVMLAIITTVGFLVKSWLDAKKAAEEFQKTMEGMIDTFEELTAADDRELLVLKLRRQTMEAVAKATTEEDKASARVLGRLIERLALEKFDQQQVEKRTKAEEQLRQAILTTQAQTIEATAESISAIEEAHAIRLRLIDEEHAKQLEATQNLQLADEARQAAIDAAEQDRKQKIDDFTEKVIGSIEKQESALEKMTAEGDKRLQQLLDNALKAKQAQTDAAVTTAQAELEQARASDATFTKIIELTNNLVKAQQKRIDVEIEAKEAALLSLRAQAEESGEAAAAVEDHIRLLERQLDLLKAQRVAATGAILDLTTAFKKQVESAADSLAKDFVDRFIDLLDFSDKSKKFGDKLLALFAGVGRTIFSQALQEMLAEALKPLVAQQIAATGKAPTSIAGLLFGTTKQALGFGGAGTSPLDRSALLLDQSATALLTAATALQSAAAGRALPTLAGGGASDIFADVAGPGTSMADLLDMEEGLRMSISNAFSTADLSGFQSNFQGVLSGLVDFFSSGLSGLGSLFGDIGGGISNLFGFIGGLFGFGHGGMVLNPHAMRAFQSGGQVPIMAHEGEFVMRRGATQSIGAGTLDEMNRTGRLPSGDDRPIEQRIFFVDQRQKLRPGDVEFIIEDSIHRERGPGKAVKNMIRRTRAG